MSRFIPGIFINRRFFGENAMTCRIFEVRFNWSCDLTKNILTTGEFEVFLRSFEWWSFLHAVEFWTRRSFGLFWKNFCTGSVLPDFCKADRVTVLFAHVKNATLEFSCSVLSPFWTIIIGQQGSGFHPRGKHSSDTRFSKGGYPKFPIPKGGILLGWNFFQKGGILNLKCS